MTDAKARQLFRRGVALAGAALLSFLSIRTATADPILSNLRVDGIAVQQGLYFSSADLGRDYNVLIDFASDLPLDRVLFEVRWQDGRVSTIQEGAFEGLRVFRSTGSASSAAQSGPEGQEDVP